MHYKSLDFALSLTHTEIWLDSARREIPRAGPVQSRSRAPRSFSRFIQRAPGIEKQLEQVENFPRESGEAEQYALCKWNFPSYKLNSRERLRWIRNASG